MTDQDVQARLDELEKVVEDAGLEKLAKERRRRVAEIDARGEELADEARAVTARLVEIGQEIGSLSRERMGLRPGWVPKLNAMGAEPRNVALGLVMFASTNRSGGIL